MGNVEGGVWEGECGVEGVGGVFWGNVVWGWAKFFVFESKMSWELLKHHLYG